MARSLDKLKTIREGGRWGGNRLVRGEKDEILPSSG
jgi:hypothetical protein